MPTRLFILHFPFRRPVFPLYLKSILMFRRSLTRKLICIALFMMAYALITPPVFASVVTGQGISKHGEYIRLGQIKIPWSKANQHFGYVYKMPGLSFANVSSGPSIWQPTAYQSYNGFQSIEAIGPSSQIPFSNPEMIVFSASASPSYQSLNRGILLVRYYHTYGAIYFDMISQDTIRYHYWYNPSGQCSFGTEITSTGTNPISTATPFREFNEVQAYSQLEITGGETFVFHEGLSVEETLKITNGKVILKGDALTLNHVTIQENGTLEILPDAILSIKGNVTNQGALSVKEGTIVLNGTGLQFVSGALQCYALEIENPYCVITDRLTVEELSIFDGVLVPGAGSAFHAIFIDTSATFYSAYLAKTYITGGIWNEGTFYHNEGTVILSGQDPEYILLNGDFFYNLEILCPKIMVDELRVKNNLFMNPGVIVSTLTFAI